MSFLISQYRLSPPPCKTILGACLLGRSDLYSFTRYIVSLIPVNQNLIVNLVHTQIIDSFLVLGCIEIEVSMPEIK